MESGIHELAAGYALDALDQEERSAFEEHLEECERCREELASFWEVTGALAVAATGPEPRPELRELILERARAERQNVVPLPARRRPTVAAVGALAALAAAVAIGLGIWAVSLSNELDETRTALEQQEGASAVLADPSARTVALTGAEGQLVVARNGRAVLVLDGFSLAPKGKTYQAWVIEGGAPVSAGLFPGAPTTTAILLELAVPEGAVVGVTLERAGGAEAPTMDPLVASKPV